MWTAILVLLFLLLFTGIISLGIGKEDDNDAAIVIGFVVSVLVVILFIIYGALGTNGIESVLPLLEHIDKGKTVIKEEKLTENAEKMGKIFRDEVNKINSPFIVQVRGRGLLNAIVTKPQRSSTKSVQAQSQKSE